MSTDTKTKTKLSKSISGLFGGFHRKSKRGRDSDKLSGNSSLETEGSGKKNGLKIKEDVPVTNHNGVSVTNQNNVSVTNQNNVSNDSKTKHNNNIHTNISTSQSVVHNTKHSTDNNTDRNNTDNNTDRNNSDNSTDSTENSTSHKTYNTDHGTDRKNVEYNPLLAINLINNNSKTVILNTFKNTFDSHSSPSTPTQSRSNNQDRTSDRDKSTDQERTKTFTKNSYTSQNRHFKKTEAFNFPRVENHKLTQLSSITVSNVHSKTIPLNVASTTRAPKLKSAQVEHIMDSSPLKHTAIKNNKRKKKYSLDNFDVTITLGTGTFGRVFLAEERNSDGVYAIKIMRMKDIIKLNQVEHVNSEREVLQCTQHPFIVKSYWMFRDERCLYMLLEYVPGGELFTYLKNEGKFSASDAIFYVSEIISVLGYLHEKDIVYRDLKPENLLVDTDGHLKFTDFGFSKILQCTTWTLCGTPEYLSPEAIQGKGHDTTCDWWALGILTYEMLVGEAPFVDDHPFGLYEKILACQIIWPSYLKGTEQQDFIQKLIVVDRSKRLGKGQNGTEDVKGHAWLRYINWDDVYNRKLKPPIKPKVAFKGDTSNFDDFEEDWELKHIHEVTLAERDNFGEWDS